MRLIIHRGPSSYGTRLCVNPQEAAEHREFLLREDDLHRPILVDEAVVLSQRETEAVAALDAIDTATDPDDGRSFRQLLETFLRIGLEAGLKMAKTL